VIDDAIKEIEVNPTVASVEALTCVGRENLGNISGHSLICREESEGHDLPNMKVSE